jgi:hypothetical protein
VSNCKSGSKLSCEIRCMDPAAVESALRRLDPTGMERVAYTCQLSGKEEEVLLVGDQLASRLAEALPEAEDTNGARILAALCSAELCECDVVTLAGLPEEEVMLRLRRFAATELLVHRILHAMHYYKLGSATARQAIEGAIEALA